MAAHRSPSKCFHRDAVQDGLAPRPARAACRISAANSSRAPGRNLPSIWAVAVCGMTWSCSRLTACRVGGVGQRRAPSWPIGPSLRPARRRCPDRRRCPLPRRPLQERAGRRCQPDRPVGPRSWRPPRPASVTAFVRLHHRAVPAVPRAVSRSQFMPFSAVWIRYSRWPPRVVLKPPHLADGLGHALEQLRMVVTSQPAP